MAINNILALQYADRQLILVTDDDVAERAQAKLAKRNKTRNQNPENSTAENVAHTAGALTAGIASASTLGATLSSLGLSAIIPPLGIAAGLLILAGGTWKVINSWGKAEESGIRILPIGRTAAKAITFPPTHPRAGVLYVGHPALANIYCTMADFHRVTFEHKVCEAVELLQALGATKIQVEHVTGWSKEFSARLSVPLGHADGTAAFNAGKESNIQRALLFQQSLAGIDKPRLPENLFWFDHEPTWKSVAKGRLEYGLNDFSLNVTYEQDFGINAGLKTAIVKVGLDIGGKFEDHQKTVWRVEGKFAGILK